MKKRVDEPVKPHWSSGPLRFARQSTEAPPSHTAAYAVPPARAESAYAWTRTDTLCRTNMGDGRKSLFKRFLCPPPPPIFYLTLW